jgi:hypothetical protein
MGSAAYDRFLASTSIDYDRWHDGVGYDLDALRALDPDEQFRAEHWLLARAANDWRDIEALLAIGSDKARAAVVDQLRTGKLEQRLWAATYLAGDPALAADREAAVVAGLASALIYGGLGLALDLASEERTPTMIDALFRACLRDEGEAAVHAAARLAFIHGKAKEPFDWDRRQFFLQFGVADPAVKRTAFEQLCGECGVDPARYLANRGVPATLLHEGEGQQGVVVVRELDQDLAPDSDERPGSTGDRKDIRIDAERGDPVERDLSPGTQVDRAATLICGRRDALGVDRADDLAGLVRRDAVAEDHVVALAVAALADVDEREIWPEDLPEHERLPDLPAPPEVCGAVRDAGDMVPASRVRVAGRGAGRSDKGHDREREDRGDQDSRRASDG